MNEKELARKLGDEGFSNIFVRQDRPNASYPDHSHSSITVHIVLEGEITVTSEGVAKTYRSGDRFDVPAGTVHSANTGPNGCRYIIGEK